MNPPCTPPSRLLTIAAAAIACLLAQQPALAQPSSAAIEAFQRCAADAEAQLLSPSSTVALADARLQRGEAVLQQLSPTQQPAGAMVHRWRGTVLIPGATAGQLERLLRDYSAFPRVFAPEVLAARAQPLAPDRVEATLRVRQRHVLTVVLDATYDVRFQRQSSMSGYSISRSTRMAEVADAGTATEHTLPPADEHGFLWRLNTYWTYRQCDGGLLVQLEAVSLSRAVPTGLAWALRPYVTRIPRESLLFTLNAAAAALRSGTPTH